MPTFDTLRQDFDDRNLIRKIQKAIGLIAPTSVDLPDTLFTGAGTLMDLKTAGWLPIGIVTPDGYEFGRDINKEDVTALGYASPVRSDITEVARTVTMTPLETGRKHLLELTYGTDLSAVTHSTTTGEIVFDEPDLPVGEEYRLLIIGSDGPASANWILGRGYGSAKLASTDSQKWGTGDPVSQPLTFDVFTDAVLGTPVRHYIGGTGALAHATALGFAAAGA
ncbi:major tail protein [Arthrobacter phage Gusanita]|nr:major tail protein [Arthrobacter phage Gusanita]